MIFRTPARLNLGLIVAVTSLLAPAVALAHPGHGGVSSGFIAGFGHPMLGLDHVVAMITLALWGAQLGKPANWVLPAAFPLLMAGGAILGALGVSLPGADLGIVVYAMALGLMVMLAARPPLWVAGILVSLFAVFHGHTHGSGLPGSANAISYTIGFVVATATLYALGILIGANNRWRTGALSLRAAGAFISACGTYFLVSRLIAG
jgi:urease accessory protein